MELYAAMVENLDHHVGRLIAYLKDKGLYENTLVVFMSDNGAAGEDFYNEGPYVDYIQARYDNRMGNMGGPDSFVSYGRGWAEAGSAPFKRHKGYTSEGGIVAPLIAAGVGVRRQGEIERNYLTVMDLAPTLIELAGARYPDDGSVQAMRGASMAALLEGSARTLHPEDYVTAQFMKGRAYLRRGNWKITQIETPFEESRFALYDLQSDPGETRDLSQSKPDRFKDMIELWRQQRMELGIALPQDL